MTIRHTRSTVVHLKLHAYSGCTTGIGTATSSGIETPCNACSYYYTCSNSVQVSYEVWYTYHHWQVYHSCRELLQVVVIGATKIRLVLRRNSQEKLSEAHGMA